MNVPSKAQSIRDTLTLAIKDDATWTPENAKIRSAIIEFNWPLDVDMSTAAHWPIKDTSRITSQIVIFSKEVVAWNLPLSNHPCWKTETLARCIYHVRTAYHLMKLQSSTKFLLCAAMGSFRRAEE
jgi:hypothetical protein